MPLFDDDSGSSPSAPTLYPGRFVFDESGEPMKEVWIYTDVPGDDKFKLENRWKTNDRGVAGKLLENTKYNFYYDKEERETSWLESKLTEKDCKLVTTATASDGALQVKIPKKPVAIETCKVVSLTFKSDHNKLKDNDQDWRKAGSRFAKPEWTDGKPSHPVSQTMDTEVTVEIEVEVKPADAVKTKGKLIGKGGDLLSFEQEIELSAGKSTHLLKSNAKLPKEVKVLDGLDITWHFEAEGTEPLPESKTEGHKIFVTIAEPREEGLPEDGATVKRMHKAIEWAGGPGDREPVDIVNSLFGNFSGYVLGYEFLSRSQQEYLKSHPEEKAKLEAVDFAAYKNSSVGGAWPLSEFSKYGGECQAMVRCIRGILTQTGCPGDAKVKYVNANANDPYKEVIRDYGSRCEGPDSSKRYALVDGRVEVDKKYDNSDGVGWNNYEAYMHYKYEDKGGWFGGGIGKLPSTQNPLNVFYALVEFEVDFAEGYKRKVTRLWEYGEHDWPTWTDG